MIWFFHRGTQNLQYEIRESSGPPGYELIVMGPDGVARVERFTETIGLLERSLELQRDLLQDGWSAERSAQRDDWRWVVASPGERPEKKDEA